MIDPIDCRLVIEMTVSGERTDKAAVVIICEIPGYTVELSRLIMKKSLQNSFPDLTAVSTDMRGTEPYAG